MPIRLDSSGGDTPPVKPDTNAHNLLTVLLDHPDIAFLEPEPTVFRQPVYGCGHHVNRTGDGGRTDG